MLNNRLIAVALAAALQGSLGSAIAGSANLTPIGSISTPCVAPPVTHRASSTRSASVSPWGYSRFSNRVSSSTRPETDRG